MANIWYGEEGDEFCDRRECLRSAGRLGPKKRGRGAAAAAAAQSAALQDEFVSEVKEILGHRRCDPSQFDITVRRNTLAEKNETVEYLVQGIFTTDDDADLGGGDMRWLNLDTILETVDGAEVKQALKAYEKALCSALKKDCRECNRG